MVTTPSRIGNNRDDIDNDQIIAEANRNDDESSQDENNSEGIDIDLDGNDMQTEEEDESNTITETNNWFNYFFTRKPKKKWVRKGGISKWEIDADPFCRAFCEEKLDEENAVTDRINNKCFMFY